MRLARKKIEFTAAGWAALAVSFCAAFVIFGVWFLCRQILTLSDSEPLDEAEAHSSIHTCSIGITAICAVVLCKEITPPVGSGEGVWMHPRC